MAAESKLQGSTILNRYKLDGELARGGLCAVYRGQDVVLRRSVVVKAIPPDLAPIYRASLHMTATFTHPAVIATYDAIDQDGWLYLVQEFVPARPLSTYITTGIPSERAVDLGGQIARALAYAHAHEIIHGDLTPAAVLIDRQATVRLNNFGLPPDERYFAETAASLGPDGAADMPPPSAEGDVIACGLLMWQVLSEPARTEPAGEERTSGRRDFRQDVPETVRELVRRCVLGEHPKRIVDADSLALELGALADELANRRPIATEQTPPALRIARSAVAREAAWSLDETLGTSRPWALYAEEEPQPYVAPAAGAEPQQAKWPQPSAQMGEPRRQPQPPPRPFNASVTMQDERAAVRQGESRAAGLSVMTYLLLFVGLFILFFLIGFFLPYMLGQHG